jgi:hypothetical protein
MCPLKYNLLGNSGMSYHLPQSLEEKQYQQFKFIVWILNFQLLMKKGGCTNLAL